MGLLHGIFGKLLNEFCHETTLHGIGRIINTARPPFERLIWAVLFLAGVVGTGISCLQIWERFSDKSVITYVDTTQYPYSSVPFPSVSLCDTSRVNWTTALSLDYSELLRLPWPDGLSLNTDFEGLKDNNKLNNGSETEKRNLVLSLLQRLAYTTFGDFDFLDQIRFSGIDLSPIEHLNISELLIRTGRSCQEMFVNPCWWRNVELDCCHLFELQRTEAGFCWSFNSDTSETSDGYSWGWPAGNGILDNAETSGDSDYIPHNHWRDVNGEIRPRRTAGNGPWSGLKITIRVMTEQEMAPDGNDTKPGVMLMVNDPRSYMMDGYKIVGPGQYAEVSISAQTVEAKERLRSISKADRGCLFADEEYIYDNPRGYFLNQNCIAQCNQKYAVVYCNCSPDFIFPNMLNDRAPFPACTTEGLICLSENNDVLTYDVPDSSREFFPETQSKGMECPCPRDCTGNQYFWTVSTTQTLNTTDTLILDVFFSTSTSILYKTDVLYDWLELTVAFGGIAGLFLGASLMSGAEIIYYMTVRFMVLLTSSLKGIQNQDLADISPLKEVKVKKVHWQPTGYCNSHNQSHICRKGNSKSPSVNPDIYIPWLN